MVSGLSAVAVYCGSNSGNDPAYAAAAASLGGTLAERGIRLVYGGGQVGLMGVVADAVMGNGGEVDGVITEALVAKEVSHRGLARLQVVGTMHERKAAMADAADAFVYCPAGCTLDEFFEVVTWISSVSTPSRAGSWTRPGSSARCAAARRRGDGGLRAPRAPRHILDGRRRRPTARPTGRLVAGHGE